MRVLLRRGVKQALKKIIPLSMRSWLKVAGYSVLDVIDPITAPRVPSRRQTTIGGGDFIAVGDSFFSILKESGLTPDMKVLDVGCGQGRMARPLTDWLQGSYHGFDIDKRAIIWCEQHYKDVANFHFIHANIFNARYNKGGQVLAGDFTFPYDDNVFDCVFLTSVFTHMFQDDVARYLSEIARVAKPNARILISWYLWEAGLPADKMDFRHKVDDVSFTTLTANPEAAMAFDINWVKALYDKAGLEIETIHRGAWAGGAGKMGLQDLIAAKVTD